MRYIWIVEMKEENLLRVPVNMWRTTVGVALNRSDARDVLRDWQIRNPSDKFRLVRYMP